MNLVSTEYQRLEYILDITRDLTATVSLDQLLHKITHAAAHLTDTELAGILLFDEASGALRFTTATHQSEKLVYIPVPIEASIAGAAFTSCTPVMVPVVNGDPRYYRAVEALTGVEARSLLAVPLQFQSRCIGVLEIENKRDGLIFNQQDVDTLLVLAAQAAIAIENARLVENLNRESQLAEAFRQASVALNSTLNYSEVLDCILEQIGLIIPGDAASIMMLDGAGQTARVFRGRGYERFGTADSLTSTTLDIDQASLLQQMQQTRQPLAIAYVEREPAWVYARPEHTWIKSYVGAPIFIRDQIVGFLNVNSATPGLFGPAEAGRLQTFAHHAAIAIENAQLYQQAQMEIAERAKAEAEVRRHRDHLEELVDARVAEIKHINAELHTQNAELDAFAHTVAHDLKNPLGLVVGYANLLLDNADSLPAEIRQQSLLNISRSGWKASSIIDSLLVLASVRQQDVLAAPIEMADVISEVWLRLADAIRESGADIHVPDRNSWPIGLGYAPWVEEIWVNYLSNALKYGGPQPRIELTAVRQPDGFIRFSVRDYGPGLTLAQQQRLFTTFERLGQVNVKGHGLGLSVVRRITDKLGGYAGVESQPGQGCTFYFTLPAAPGL